MTFNFYKIFNQWVEILYKVFEMLRVQEMRNKCWVEIIVEERRRIFQNNWKHMKLQKGLFWKMIIVVSSSHTNTIGNLDTISLNHSIRLFPLHVLIGIQSLCSLMYFLTTIYSFPKSQNITVTRQNKPSWDQTVSLPNCTSIELLQITFVF